MDGAGLQTYLQRRLAESGLNLESGRVAELYDYLTEGRDALLQAFALSCPVVVQQFVTLVVDAVDAQVYRFPAATPDPLRIIMVREKETRSPLTPAATIDFDGGEYVWENLRQLRLAVSASPGAGLEAIYVPSGADITATTTALQVGLPVTCHRAIGKYAAVLALTADEESDATNAMGLFQREMDVLEKMYGDYDASTGFSLREAIMGSAGELFNDSLY